MPVAFMLLSGFFHAPRPFVFVSPGAEGIHQGVIKQRQIDWLYKIVLNSDLLGFGTDVLATESSYHGDLWYMLQTIATLNDAARLQAVHAGHVPIHQYELIWVHGIRHS